MNGALKALVVGSGLAVAGLGGYLYHSLPVHTRLEDRVTNYGHEEVTGFFVPKFEGMPHYELLRSRIEAGECDKTRSDSSTTVNQRLKLFFCYENEGKLEAGYVKEALERLYNPEAMYQLILDWPPEASSEIEVYEWWLKEHDPEYLKGFILRFINEVHNNISTITFLGSGLIRQLQLLSRVAVGPERESISEKIGYLHADHIETFMQRYIASGDIDALASVASWHYCCISNTRANSPAKNAISGDDLRETYKKMKDHDAGINELQAFITLLVYRESSLTTEESEEIWRDTHQSLERKIENHLLDRPIDLMRYRLKEIILMKEWKPSDFGLQDVGIPDAYYGMEFWKSPDEDGAIKVLHEHFYPATPERWEDPKFQSLLQWAREKGFERFVQEAERH